MRYRGGGIGHQAACARTQKTTEDVHIPENEDDAPDNPDGELAGEDEDEEADYGYREEQEQGESDEEAEEDDGEENLGLEDGEDFDVEDMYGAEGYAPL